MQLIHPALSFDVQRDSFVLWLRWVALEKPPSPREPPGQGMRVEFKLNRNTVFGPTIVQREQLEAEDLWIQMPRERSVAVLEAAARVKRLDLQLIIHGSVANAPFLALYQVRDFDRDSYSRRGLEGTPLLQLQPSVGAGQWQVAGQANLRVQLEVQRDRRHLRVLS